MNIPRSISQPRKTSSLLRIGQPSCNKVMQYSLCIILKKNYANPGSGCLDFHPSHKCFPFRLKSENTHERCSFTGDCVTSQNNLLRRAWAHATYVKVSLGLNCYWVCAGTHSWRVPCASCVKTSAVHVVEVFVAFHWFWRSGMLF